MNKLTAKCLTAAGKAALAILPTPKPFDDWPSDGYPFSDIPVDEDEATEAYTPDPELEALFQPLYDAVQGIAASAQFRAMSVERRTDFIFSMRSAALMMDIEFDEWFLNEEEDFDLLGKEERMSKCL
jgi:hypothetical protein